MLTYREADHAYFFNDRQIPGITRVLADLGIYAGSQYYTENSRKRGQAVHTACQLADMHCPEAETLDDLWESLEVAPDLWPYLEGYLKFRREKRYRAGAWETPLFSQRLRVAGTPDSYGSMGDALALVDLKSWANQGANPKHSAEVQTAAYALMLAESLNLNPLEAHKMTRCVVKLPGDSSYRCYQCSNEDDFLEVQHAAFLWSKWHDKGIFKFAGDPNEQLVIGE